MFKIYTTQKTISTHAPHARRGVYLLFGAVIMSNFYSRASCEARRPTVLFHRSVGKISTHAPHARRGVYFILDIVHNGISTHAPHARRGDNSGCKVDVGIFISTHAPHARRGGVALEVAYA